MCHKMLENISIPYAHEIELILTYALLGGGMKYVDQAFDIGVFNKKIAAVITVPGALLMGYLMVVDGYSAMIFLAIVLGVGVSKKIDNLVFQMGLFILILTPIFFHNIVRIEWLPFGFLVMAAILDEYGNDWSDSRQLERNLRKAMKKRTDGSILKRLGELFFSHRPLLKSTVLVLVITNYFPLIYLISLLFFDGAYRTIETISFTQKTYHLTEPISQRKLSQLTAGKRGLSTLYKQQK